MKFENYIRYLINVREEKAYNKSDITIVQSKSFNVEKVKGK